MPHRLLIVEDHPLFADALCTILCSGMLGLSVESVGSLSEARRALEAETRVDLALVDLTLPDAHGLAAVIELRISHPRLPLVVMSSNSGLDLIEMVAACGAAGFFSKSAQKAEILALIRRVFDGGTCFPGMGQDVSGEGRGRQKGEVCPAVLTHKQLRVAQMLCQGLANKEIGLALGVEETTIKAHVSEILRKLKVNSRTQAVLQFARVGFGTSTGTDLLAGTRTGTGEAAGRPYRQP